MPLPLSLYFFNGFNKGLTFSLCSLCCSSHFGTSAACLSCYILCFHSQLYTEEVSGSIALPLLPGLTEPLNQPPRSLQPWFKFRQTASDTGLQCRQDVKELVRSAGDALSMGFLGSLESFLTYLQALMHFCECFARDDAATRAMLVRSHLLFLLKPALACGVLHHAGRP